MRVDEIIGRFVCMDVLVHTWDLARTVGADEHLDEELVRQAYDALQPMDAMIRQPGVFGAKLEPPPARICRRSSCTSSAVGPRAAARTCPRVSGDSSTSLESAENDFSRGG